MIVDAHHHLWRPDRGDYHWLGAAPEILRCDYMPADLAPILTRFGVVRTVLVQAAQTVAETDFLLDLAEKTEFIAGVVGWLDLEDEDFPAMLRRYSARPKLVGLRPMLQDLDDDAWILRPRVLRGLERIAESGLAFDLLTYPCHLKSVAAALELVPGLRAVVDHLSKPPIRSGEVEPWKDDMARLASFSTLHCKLSGMITEADPSHWSVSQLEPYVRHVADCFGADRLMFGSDWPVCRSVAEYGEVLAATLLALPHEMRGDERVLFQNAVRFYRLSLQDASTKQARNPLAG